MPIRVGCCGWGFFRPREFYGVDWKGKYSSTIQAYAKKFDLVEVNSTFYRIPKVETAERWLEEARAVNPDFEFTVKAFRGITHEEKFAGKSPRGFESIKKICRALDSKILLFQTAASFGPTPENIRNMRSFFRRIRSGNLTLVWEPRGEWHRQPEKIKEMCNEFGLIECVDPLRNELAVKNARLAYFRLHGFGKPMMYNYKFNEGELRRIKARASAAKAKDTYVLFNNYHMYRNALEFVRLL